MNVIGDVLDEMKSEGTVFEWNEVAPKEFAIFVRADGVDAIRSGKAVIEWSEETDELVLKLSLT